MIDLFSQPPVLSRDMFSSRPKAKKCRVLLNLMAPSRRAQRRFSIDRDFVSEREIRLAPNTNFLGRAVAELRKDDRCGCRHAGLIVCNPTYSSRHLTTPQTADTPAIPRQRGQSRWHRQSCRCNHSCRTPSRCRRWICRRQTSQSRWHRRCR